MPVRNTWMISKAVGLLATPARGCGCCGCGQATRGFGCGCARLDIYLKKSFIFAMTFGLASGGWDDFAPSPKSLPLLHPVSVQRGERTRGGCAPGAKRTLSLSELSERGVSRKMSLPADVGRSFRTGPYGS